MHDTYGKDAFIARKNMMELAEETRMLYVGMTRAMRRLYLVGVIKPDKTEKWNIKAKAGRLLETESMLDMFMPTVLNGIKVDKEGILLDDALWKVTFTKAQKLDAVKLAGKKNNLPKIQNDIDFGKYWDRARLGSTTLPAKTAVTYIKDENFNMTSDEEEQNEERIGTFELGDEMEEPEYMASKMVVPVGAELGTLLHKFMRIIPLNEFYRNTDANLVKSCMSKMLDDSNSISDVQAEELRKTMLDGIAKFIISNYGQSLCNPASNIRREQDFVVKVCVNGQNVLMQGVIDLLAEDDKGNWEIVDYKTDYNTSPASLIEKHGTQLNYYKKAIEAITEKKVAKMYIVTARNGNVVEVPEMEVKYM
jgi:ATP-dependent helicase/nuclease subunit A